MIAHLRGKLAAKSLEEVVVETGGVGYSVLVSATTLAKLPRQGEQAFIYVHTHNHERGLDLFGFHSTQERAVFRLLVSISGVGPRLALSILSAADVSDLADAVAAEDVRRLTRIPGVGKKTAGRMLVELKESLPKLGVAGAGGGRTAGSGSVAAVVGMEAAATAAAGAISADGGGPEALRQRLASVHAALCNMGYKPAVVDRAIRELRRDKASPERSLEELLKSALKLLAKPKGKA
jgi:Holliday junction DNA helicase RuvA